MAICECPLKMPSNWKAYSGKPGLFIARTNIHERGEEVVWLHREPLAEPEAYHLRILALAASRDQFAKCRRNGGRDLGLIKLSSDPAQRALFIADIQGIPPKWDGEDVCSFLQAEQWSDAAIVHRRRAGRGIFCWAIKAKPHPNQFSGPWSYVDAQDSQWNVLISKVAWSAHRPDTMPVRAPRHNNFRFQFLTSQPQKFLPCVIDL